MSDHVLLHSRLLKTKKFLNREMVRMKTSGGASPVELNFVGAKLDFIHEAERIGIRNLDERYNRKLNKLFTDLNMDWDDVSLN